MSNVVLASSFKFPPGTSVGAYPTSNWLRYQVPPSGSPQGSASETKTVAADGTLTFTTLTNGVRYYAYASVGGVDTYLHFSGPSAGSPYIADKSIKDIDVADDAAISKSKLGPQFVVAAGNLGASYALDAQSRDDVLMTGTLNANNALTFTNLVAGVTVKIIVTQDGTGSRTLTVNGAAVAVNSSPAAVTVLRAYSPDGSTVYVDAPSVVAPPYESILPWRAGLISAGTVAGTWAVLSYNSVTGSIADQAGLSVVYLDPADYGGDPNRVTKYRLRAYLLTNTVSLGTTTLTFGLYPITASAGGAGAVTMTSGTVITGSTAAFVNPATSSRLQVNSGDFVAPVAGFYAVEMVITANTAANSRALFGVTLEARQV